MRYALLNDHAVENIIWLSASNAGDFPLAVPIGDVPVQTGDRWADGAFYRDGEMLMSPAQEADMILNELMGGVEDVRQE